MSNTWWVLPSFILDANKCVRICLFFYHTKQETKWIFASNIMGNKCLLFKVFCQTIVSKICRIMIFCCFVEKWFWLNDSRRSTTCKNIFFRNNFFWSSAFWKKRMPHDVRTGLDVCLVHLRTKYPDTTMV